jgi:hypothetical protein
MDLTCGARVSASYLSPLELHLSSPPLLYLLGVPLKRSSNVRHGSVRGMLQEEGGDGRLLCDSRLRSTLAARSKCVPPCTTSPVNRMRERRVHKRDDLGTETGSRITAQMQ